MITHNCYLHLLFQILLPCKSNSQKKNTIFYFKIYHHISLIAKKKDYFFQKVLPPHKSNSQKKDYFFYKIYHHISLMAKKKTIFLDLCGGNLGTRNFWRNVCNFSSNVVKRSEWENAFFFLNFHHSNERTHGFCACNRAHAHVMRANRFSWSRRYFWTIRLLW